VEFAKQKKNYKYVWYIFSPSLWKVSAIVRVSHKSKHHIHSTAAVIPQPPSSLLPPHSPSLPTSTVPPHFFFTSVTGPAPVPPSPPQCLITQRKKIETVHKELTAIAYLILIRRVQMWYVISSLIHIFDNIHNSLNIFNNT
jgi:hypothetical protein